MGICIKPNHIQKSVTLLVSARLQCSNAKRCTCW